MNFRSFKIGQYKISFGHCCGTRCATLSRMVSGQMKDLANGRCDYDEYNTWQSNFNPALEDILEWTVVLSALKQVLANAVGHGLISQEEADKILREFYKRFPKPEAPINVTKEFRKLNTEKVAVELKPKKVKVDF